ncbi:MAG: S-layer homology domain-containing protein [Oscillospiraceae bacterium]|jgi:hypothetical protein|nr:S-layer homology domain-containing protein [Oscillospiraceae bacterium]
MKRIVALILGLAFALSLSVAAFAADKSDVDKAVADAAAYMLKAVPMPEVGSVGGEWAVVGLARSGASVPQSYYDEYYLRVEQYVKECKGVLHDKKYTEYSRLIVALTAAGYNPCDIAGYDLTIPLGDFDKTIWQGLNGPIWALIALDSGNYEVPANPDAKTQATRDKYITEILRRQLGDGGWNLNAGSNGTDVSPDEIADPDITGMALQALAKYQDRKDVKTAVDKALSCLSKMQDEKGGYHSWNTTNSESVVQVLVAITELGLKCDDSRFVKNGFSLIDNLLSFGQPDGSFIHTSDGSGVNQMSSEQCFYGLIAAQRSMEGKNSLYRMSDAVKRKTPEAAAGSGGLPGKNSDVKQVPVETPGKTFGDIKGHAFQTSIESLCSRGIIAGMDGAIFAPDAAMTRAQFTAIVVRGLGLDPKADTTFSDVPPSAWYAGYVGTASKYGIVNGTAPGKFTPDGVITRQEAATMLAGAAELCGIDTILSSFEIRDILAQFGDYTSAADWAREPLAFCYKIGALDESELNIEPTEAVTRAEIANMLYVMLGEADLL